MLAFAAIHDLEMEQLDVQNAFLNGIIREDVYIRLPEGYTKPGKVCKLKKTLYGLCQSPREWYEVVHSLMTKFCFTRTHADHAVFVKQGIVVLVYVDDISLFATTKKLMHQTKQQLLTAYSMTDLGLLQEYLDMQIIRDRTARSIMLSQSFYIQKVLAHFGYVDGQKVVSPMEAKALFSPNAATATSNAVKDYQSKVGALT